MNRKSFIVLAMAVMAVVVWGQFYDTLPVFNETSTVVVDEEGFVVVTNGEVVTSSFDGSQPVEMANGSVVILQEVKGGKYVGPIGWRFGGNDPNSHDDGDRSGHFEFVKP